MAKFQPEMVGDREEPAKGRMLMNEVGEETKAGWACGSRIKEVGRVISRGDENRLFLLVTLTRDAWRRGSAAEGKKPGGWIPGQLGPQSIQTTLSNVPVREMKD